MLLRRITKHVTDQNWFAVFIDFLIVVTGVFIGIQVANWNASLSDKAIAQEYLERLSIDFEKIEKRLTNNNIPGFDEALDAIEIVDAVIKSGKKPTEQDDLEFRAALNIIDGSAVPAWHSASYIEMQSAGDLRLLTNKTLKIALTDYNQSTEIAHKGWTVLMDARTIISDRVNLLREFEAVKDAIDGIEASVVINYDFQKMIDDPRLKSDLSSLAQIQSNNRVLQKLQLEKAKVVLEILNQGADK